MNIQIILDENIILKEKINQMNIKINILNEIIKDTIEGKKIEQKYNEIIMDEIDRIEKKYLYIIYEKILYLIMHNIQLLTLPVNQIQMNVYETFNCLKGIQKRTTYTQITDDEIDTIYRCLPLLWNHVYCNKSSLYPDSEKEKDKLLCIYIKKFCLSFNEKCPIEFKITEKEIENMINFFRKIQFEIN